MRATIHHAVICFARKRNSCDSLRQANATGKSLLIIRNRVKSVAQKYSAFVLTQISRITPPVSPQMRDARERHERAVGCDGRGGRDRRARRMRTAKSCGSGVAVLALRSGEARLLWDNGGKRAVLRGEHEVSRKAIAQGRPECSRCPVCPRAAFCWRKIAHGTAGAASTRSSLRPLIEERANEDASLGQFMSRDRERTFARYPTYESSAFSIVVTRAGG
jgi:hypothetical protein